MTPLHGGELRDCVPDSSSELILDIDSILVSHSPTAAKEGHVHAWVLCLR